VSVAALTVVVVDKEVMATMDVVRSDRRVWSLISLCLRRLAAAADAAIIWGVCHADKEAAEIRSSSVARKAFADMV